MDFKAVLKDLYKDEYDKAHEYGDKLYAAAFEAGSHNRVAIDEKVLGNFVDSYMILRCLTSKMKNVNLSAQIFNEYGDLDGSISIKCKSIEFEHPKLFALAVQKCGNFEASAFTDGSIALDFTFNNLANYLY